MPTKFKSFEEFGQAAKQEQVQSLKQQIDDIFEKSIREDFDSIPVGSFKSNLPEKVDMEAIEKQIAQRKMDEGETEPEISKDELREATLEHYWKPISDKAKTRQQLMALGAQRFVHTPEKWQENVRQAIASRTQ